MGLTELFKKKTNNRPETTETEATVTCARCGATLTKSEVCEVVNGRFSVCATCAPIVKKRFEDTDEATRRFNESQKAETQSASMPSIRSVEEIGGTVVPLCHARKIAAMLTKVFAEEYTYVGCQSEMGMGDVAFLWLFVSKSQKQLMGIEGLSYYGGDIRLSTPKAQLIEETSPEAITALVSKTYSWSITREDGEKIAACLNAKGTDTVPNTAICARCKKPLQETDTFWVGNHRMCGACSQSSKKRYTKIEVARFNRGVIYIQDGVLYCDGTPITVDEARKKEIEFMQYQAYMDCAKGGDAPQEAAEKRGLVNLPNGEWVLKCYAVDRYLELLK